MQHQAKPSAMPVLSGRTLWSDRIMQGVIVGGGISVLLMLAWVHLGLGALLSPPSPTPSRMVAAASGYVVTLSTDDGHLVVGDGNAVSFAVHDSAGYPVTDATVHVRADMTTMAMPVPDVTATALGGGRYVARLAFTMAGRWRLTVTTSMPRHHPVQAAFDVDVRWH